MPSRNTYGLTWVSLTLGMGYLFRLLQQSAATAPYLGQGVSPHVEYLECGVAPLGPPAPTQPLLLGRGVAPHSHSCAIAVWRSRSPPLTATSVVHSDAF